MTERNDRPEPTEAGPKKTSASRTPGKKAATTTSSTGKAGTRKASAGKGTASKGTAGTAKGDEAAVRPVPASRNAFAAGAARASGERRRRSGTPLLSALSGRRNS